MDKKIYLEHRLGRDLIPIYTQETHNGEYGAVIHSVIETSCCGKSIKEHKVVFSLSGTPQQIGSMLAKIKPHKRAIKDYKSELYGDHTYMTIVHL